MKYHASYLSNILRILYPRVHSIKLSKTILYRPDDQGAALSRNKIIDYVIFKIVSSFYTVLLSIL